MFDLQGFWTSWGLSLTSLIEFDTMTQAGSLMCDLQGLWAVLNSLLVSGDSRWLAQLSLTKWHKQVAWCVIYRDSELCWILSWCPLFPQALPRSQGWSRQLDQKRKAGKRNFSTREEIENSIYVSYISLFLFKNIKNYNSWAKRERKHWAWPQEPNWARLCKIELI